MILVMFYAVIQINILNNLDCNCPDLRTPYKQSSDLPVLHADSPSNADNDLLNDESMVRVTYQ